MYKLYKNGIFRIADTAFIPKNVDNIDYKKYLDWLAEGNTPDPADIPPPPTYRELRAAAHIPVQDQLDMIYWDQVNNTTNFKDYVAAIKAQYPKV